jgi:hypothetical protein
VAEFNILLSTQLDSQREFYEVRLASHSSSSDASALVRASKLESLKRRQAAMEEELKCLEEEEKGVTFEKSRL